MSVAYVAVTIAAIVANAWAAIADAVSARFVLANAAELDVPRSWVPFLGACKAAGAAGLGVGLFGVRPLGIAAAIGLVAFFASAVGLHVWKRAFHNLAAPLVFLALAAGSLALS
jgi:hypothetical protein